MRYAGPGATAQAERCMRCGNCQAVCPVYREERLESGVARGRLAAIRRLQAGELEPDDALYKRVFKCTLCMACEAHCPSGVRTQTAFLGAREALADRTPLFKGLVCRVLQGGPGDTARALKAARLVQRAAFATLGRDHLRPRLPLGLFFRRIIPQVAPRPLTAGPEVYRPAGRPRARVAFFTGCMLNYVYARTGRAVVQVLVGLGFEVVVPRGQHCCGTPLLAAGKTGAARELARYNVTLFSEVRADLVVTACASCGGALRHGFSDLTGAEEARALAEIACDFAMLIADGRLSTGFRGAVTYHHPCHLIRGQGVSEEPVALLEGLGGAQYVASADADSCCGGGGTFSLEYYGLARRIGARKVSAALKAGARALVTECPACVMHLTDCVHLAGAPLEVLHLADLLTLEGESAGCLT